MAITRTPIIDDNGSGTTGTIIDNAWKQEFYDQIDAADASSASGEELVSTTGAVALSASVLTHYVRLQPAVNTTIPVSFAGGAGVGGERVILINNGPGVATIAPSATFTNVVTSAPTPLGPGGTAVYTLLVTGGLHWVLTAHEQGQWIAAPYSGANFTGNGGSWTVDAGDVADLRYRLSGSMLTVAFLIASSSVGSGATSLVIGPSAYGGFTANGTVNGVFIGAGASLAQTVNGGGLLLFQPTIGAAWPPTTNGTNVYGQLSFPVS